MLGLVDLMRTPRHALHLHPEFRRRLVARTASVAGPVTVGIVLPILMYEVTGASLWTATAVLAQGLPYLFAGRLARLIAQRLPHLPDDRLTRLIWRVARWSRRVARLAGRSAWLAWQSVWLAWRSVRNLRRRQLRAGRGATPAHSTFAGSGLPAVPASESDLDSARWRTVPDAPGSIGGGFDETAWLAAGGASGAGSDRTAWLGGAAGADPTMRIGGVADPTMRIGGVTGVDPTMRCGGAAGVDPTSGIGGVTGADPPEWHGGAGGSDATVRLHDGGTDSTVRIGAGTDATTWLVGGAGSVTRPGAGPDGTVVIGPRGPAVTPAGPCGATNSDQTVHLAATGPSDQADRPFDQAGRPSDRTGRYRRRRLMAVADIGNALLLAAVPIAYTFGWLTAIQLLLTSLAAQLAFLCFDLADTGGSTLLTGRDRLVAGYPVLAGLALALAAPTPLLPVDMISVVVSVLLIRAIATPTPAPANAAQRAVALIPSQRLSGRLRPVARRWLAGPGRLAELRDLVTGRGPRAAVRTQTVSVLLQSAAAGSIIGQVLPWAGGTLGVPPQGDARLGLLYLAWGAGGLAAGWVGPRLLQLVGPAAGMLGALSAATLGALACLVAGGWGAAAAALACWTLAQLVALRGTLAGWPAGALPRGRYRGTLTGRTRLVAAGLAAGALAGGVGGALDGPRVAFGLAVLALLVTLALVSTLHFFRRATAPTA